MSEWHESKWREAGSEYIREWDRLFKTAKEMEENNFQWTDKRVAEACYWVGLKIKGAEDIQQQIPNLIEKYKEYENREQQKQYPEEEKIEFTHKGEKYYFLKSDMKKLNEFEMSKFGASHNWTEEHRPQYSKAQMRNCFTLARKFHDGTERVMEYSTFEDYEKYLTLLKNKTK